MAHAARLSVVVSTFNQSHILPFTLASLEEQDYPYAFEVLVCDDGSDDATFDVVRTVSERQRLDLRYIWQPDDGFRAGRSRNNAIRCAQGQVLVFIDGDVVVGASFLSLHAAAHIEAAAPTMVAGSRLWLDVDLAGGAIEGVDRLHRLSFERGYYLDKEQQSALASSGLPWTGCCGFNISITNRPEVNYDESICGWGKEDYELFCRLYHRHGYAVQYRPDIEVLHLVTPHYSDCNPWVTNAHEHIAQYVRNCLYLKRKYSDIDVTAALWPLTHFVRDAPSNRWRMAKDDERRSVSQAIADAESWLGETPDR